MDVFRLRDRLVDDYARYVRSFVEIQDRRLCDLVDEEMARGTFWPEPRVALNPAFEPGGSIDNLVAEGLLTTECSSIFQRKSVERDSHTGETRVHADPLNLHRHQRDAVVAARSGKPYVLTTGTGSGKSLAYLIPIVDHVLRRGSGQGTQAIVVYPMNALANSQVGEMKKFLCLGYPEGHPPVTFERYTGQENREERDRILANPPDILLTNYVMLELILTRVWERDLVQAARGLRFLVLDELHTYRGRQGSDVAMLVRRVREACEAPHLQCVGTSATLAAAGTYEERRAQVARVATEIFGALVEPERVIGETLRRMTVARDLADPGYAAELCGRIESGAAPPDGWHAFTADPLSTWIEDTLGVAEEPGSGRLVRSTPLPLMGSEGAAARLAGKTSLPEITCVRAIQRQLLAGYRVQDPETGFPVFAFRLHQFIRRGDTAYVSLEPPASRYLTLEAARFVPGDREHFLYPVVFCRECGQEYLRVHEQGDPGARTYLPSIEDELDPEQEANSYLYLSDEHPWSDDSGDVCERVPDDWVEQVGDTSRVRLAQRKYLPRTVYLDGLGREEPGGQRAWVVPGPFRFCLSCGVSHAGRAGEFTRLSTLSAGGRSSATTLLCLEAVRALREDGTLSLDARKVLTFTDNRQDAALQAGHFNDFVQVELLRAALYQAARHAGSDGLSHEQLVQRVFDQLGLPLHAYAVDPGVRFGARQDTDRAFREVLGYRLYVDLQRGWRLTSPNLEQCGLLEIAYQDLDEVCRAEDVWQEAHPSLAQADPEQRRRVSRVLLDHLRRELVIKVDYLDSRRQETLRQLAGQRLNDTWRFDEDERPVHAGILFPRPRREGDHRGNVFLGPRSGFGQYLRRTGVLPAQDGARLKLTDTERIIRDLLEALRTAGMVEIVEHGMDDVPGYQVVAACMRWRAGDGSHAFHDPVRIPNQPTAGLRPNPYFLELYSRGVRYERDLEAAEHTAAVPMEKRERLEQRFGTAQLPILFCSPTMELGVDIRQLNVVGLRNVPPTPANYAQRSGRAGRSGQPALVFTYCTSGSPHDQYFFRRPEQMVSGQVTPPRLDLTNEELLRAHVHSVWLAESGINLGDSLKDVLDLGGQSPTLEVLPSVQGALRDPGVRERTIARNHRVLAEIEPELQQTAWWHAGWLEDAVHALEHDFDAACERWRSLYRSAREQSDRQNQIISDVSRSRQDRERARALRGQAEQQIQLLLSEEEAGPKSDFYTYRYLAGEGFLPGYSFPRLPLSAYLPGRGRSKDEFLQRPRFIAISEFGPRNLLYFEGSRYEINRVLVRAPESGEEQSLLQAAKLCHRCGHLHPALDGDAGDICEHCHAPLDAPLEALFRLQNVSTRRRDRINCDEEERQRHGYDVRTAVRFEKVRGVPSALTAELQVGETVLARLTYGQAGTIWRINRGWRRSVARGEVGFWIDLDSGEWQRRPGAGDGEPPGDDPLGPRRRRVIPYVEDRRNCLWLEPTEAHEVERMASLQWALAAAMQAVFELEDGELGTEPMPDEKHRRSMLFYEAAEGGAGALRRLVEEPRLMAELARTALRLCHFDPRTGRPREEPGIACEAACYNCLLSYRNQRDHRLLDRSLLPDLLLRYAAAEVRTSPTARTRDEQLAALLGRCDSQLEREWLTWIEAAGCNLPDEAQTLIAEAGTKPDFLYRASGVAVYVDGPPHDFPDRIQRDQAQTELLEDLGYTVLRFGPREGWPALVDAYPGTFGRRSV